MNMDVKEELTKYENLGCLHDMFDRQVKLTPNNVAVVDDNNRSYTYIQLNDACEVLANHLVTLGVTPDRPVGIFMEKCIEYVISYISILKAGGAYMPLNISYPSKLLKEIFSDSKPVCVIVNEDTSNMITDQKIIELSGNWIKKLKSKNKKFPSIDRPKTNIDNLACIVYSSGTTGKPKGVMNPHRSSVYSYTWRNLTHPFIPEDRIASNIFFVWELLRPLLKGYPLYIIPDNVIYDPQLLVDFIQRHKITRVLFTPSLFQALMDASNIDLKDLKSLRLVWFNGEVVTTSLLERCVTGLPWVNFFNLYSISECHEVAICDLNEFWEIAKNEQKQPKFCPVGKPCPGIHVVILDEDGNALPVGMSGEIFVGGPTLARGYLNRPDAQKQRFIPRSPTVSSDAGPTLYRTGDWGLLKTDGNLEICGRCDTMVKIRGYSIEIQAVEAALMSLDFINSCVVMAIGDEGEDKRLVAYVVTDDNITKKIIKDNLKLKIPFYMIPSQFMFLDSLPVLPASGKLDKKALPPFRNRSESFLIGIEKVGPESETEKFLESVWCEILQVDFVDMQENFFELGGHSLLAARLLGKIREKFNINITMQTLFTHPTITSLANYLDHGGKVSAESSSSHIDLRKEVRLLSAGPVILDIQLRAFWRSQGFGFKANRARVLLTGATGFLGAYILKELLLQTKAQVYCLVRRDPEKSAEDRLMKNMEFYDLFKALSKDLPKAFRKKVKPVVGDVALLELGLSEEDYTYLSYEIDYIIHAAAYVNLLYPYEALKAANVAGTRNVLLFARTGKIKPLHYVSTNSVFPNNLISCAEIASSDVDIKLLENGYSQSKWVAEQLVMASIPQGLPVTIHRIGNICGDSVTAGWNPTDFILLVLRASIITSSWPDVEWYIEMTPVDFVSNCIVKLSQDVQLSNHKIFHIVQPNGFSGRWLFEWLKKEFKYNLELVPFEQWCDRVESLEGTSQRFSSAQPDVRTMLHALTSTKDRSLFSYKTTFDQTNLLSAIATLGLKYPQINGSLLRTYIKEMVKNKVIPAPYNYRDSPLNGQVAIVTGASSGIGRETALVLANAGVKVCLSARSVDKLEELQKKIEADNGVATIFKCDVVKRDQVQDMVKHVEELWGSIDILVNNAGVMYYTHMSSLLMDEWESMVDVNCKGVLNGIGAVLPGMIKNGKGHIINMSSDAGISGFPGLAVYSGTKFFVEGVSEALRREMVDNGIKVTCIRPGDVKTNINTVVIDQSASDKYDQYSTRKILDPEDIANAVLFAASQPEHSAVNSILIEPRLAPI